MTRESDIERYLKNRVEAQDGEVRKVKWIGRRGAPDRLVLLNRFNALVELKRPGEKLKPHQEREIARLRAAGMRVEVIDSYEGVDWLIEEWQQQYKVVFVSPTLPPLPLTVSPTENFGVVR